MPTLETIRRLKVEATTAGVAQTAAELNKLSAAQEGVAKSANVMATSTDNASKGAASTAERYRRQTLMLDEAARKQDQYAKAARVADQMQQIGKITAEQHAQRIADLSAKYQQASVVSKAFGEATSGLSAQLIAMSAGAGPVGIFLSGLGKWGLAAAVGIGGAVTAFQAFSQAAHDIATKSSELKKFADTTGFTTDQVQNLNKEAKKFDVSSEDLEGGLRKFAAGFQELREGGGSLLQSIRRVNGGLAEQMQTDETAADALVHLQQAILSTDNVFEQSRIARAALGRGGVGAIEFLKSADLSKLNADIAGIGYGLDKNLIAKTYELNKQIEETDKKIAHAFGADFAPFFLRLELGWKKYELSVIEGLGRIKKGFEGAFIPPDTAQSTFVAGREAGVPAALLNQQQKLNSLLQDQLDFMEKIRREQGDTDNPALERAVAISARLRDQLSEVEAKIAKIGGGSSADQMVDRMLPMPAAPPALVPKEFQPKEIEAQIADYQLLKNAIGALVPVEQQVANEANKLALALMEAPQNAKPLIQEMTAALLAQVRVQAELAAVAPGTYERQLAALEALKAAFPGLTAAQAQVALALNQQLTLAQAVTGQQKMMVQAGIDYQSAIDRGLTTEQAAAEAAQKHAIAVAQVTAAAQAQLLSLRDQYAVASAVTGAEKMRAQATATTNQLLRDGVEYYTAMAVAAQELKNAQAAATAAVEQSIHGLEQELEVLKASTQAEKDRVLARQAYDNAVRSGADEEAARRLQAATEAVSEEKRRQAEDNARLKAQDEQRLALLKQMVAAENEYSAAIERIYSGQDRLINQMDNMQFAIPSGGTRDTGIPWGFGKVSFFGPTAPGGTGPSNFDPITNKFTDSIETDALQKQKEAFEISRVQAQISGDKGAEINAVQGELNFYKAQPQTLENLNQIKSLMDALTELTKATEDNTAATATISDIYASGHSARIGYYAEGQTTKTIGQPTISSNAPVWGNPMTTPAPANSNVPRSPMWAPYAGIAHFAEGGTVTRPTLALVGEAGPEDITPVGKRGGPPTVVQNFNIMMPARSDLGDRSTQRQMFEGIGRRAAVAR